MSGAAVMWADNPDDPRGETPETQAHVGEVDDTFAARRLRRWLKGMFGGSPKPAPESDDPGRELERDS